MAPEGGWKEADILKGVLPLLHRSPVKVSFHKTPVFLSLQTCSFQVPGPSTRMLAPVPELVLYLLSLHLPGGWVSLTSTFRRTMEELGYSMPLGLMPAHSQKQPVKQVCIFLLHFSAQRESLPGPEF